MSTHIIHLYYKLRKISLNTGIRFLKNFLGTQKQVQIIHSKQVIGVRVIEVLLYSVLLPRPSCSKLTMSLVTYP